MSHTTIPVPWVCAQCVARGCVLSEHVQEGGILTEHVIGCVLTEYVHEGVWQEGVCSQRVYTR